MDVLDLNPVEGERRPKTLVVLTLLSLAALVFSYLWAYCLTDALVSAEIRSPIGAGDDPRPRWLVTGWFVLMSVFLVAGWVLKVASARQMRSIDAMEDE
jgi:hypothetical protein